MLRKANALKKRSGCTSRVFMSTAFLLFRGPAEVVIYRKKIEAVLALPIEQKYDYFIKKSVGWGEMWSL